jgi:carbonic anhydrase
MPAIERLLAGFKVFKAQNYEHRPELFARLIAEGQRPEVLIIACSDSRVDPAILLDAQPGELFVVRNVANLVPPYNPDRQHHGTSSAVEFAVRDLGVQHIVVLGHAHCGGIQALRSYHHDPARQRDRHFIASWVKIAESALKSTYGGVHHPDPQPGDSHSAQIEQDAIRISLANLSGFPWIADAVAAGKLRLHGWWFDLDHGRIWSIDPFDGEFDCIA